MSKLINYYDVLKISENASLADIKKAYRKQIRYAHPDTGGTAEAFRNVSEAYATLGDATEKQKYDVSRKQSVRYDFFTHTHTEEKPFNDQEEPDEPLSPENEVFYNDSVDLLAEQAARMKSAAADKRRQENVFNQELIDLTRIGFPIRLFKGVATRLSEFYVSSRLKGTPQETVSAWKRSDLFIVRVICGLGLFLGLWNVGVEAATVGVYSVLAFFLSSLFKIAIFSAVGAIVAAGVTFLTQFVRWARLAVENA